MAYLLQELNASLQVHRSVVEEGQHRRSDELRQALGEGLGVYAAHHHLDSILITENKNMLLKIKIIYDFRN